MKDQNNVDTTQTTTCLEWCAGYGGISLGLKRAIPSLRTIAFGEIEAFACANLVAKMEAGLLDCAPIWTDIKTFPCEAFRDRVDILVAGYPCQPFSSAGKRLGAEDPRHLWPYIQRSISIIRPRLCFFENVEGHISLGLSTVISDLEELGYKVSWGIFSASEVGAPHQRKRVFILAHRKNIGLPGAINATDQGGAEWWQGLSATRANCSTAWPSRPGEQQHWWEPPRVVGAVPAKLANFCSRDSQQGRDTAQAGRESVSEWRESEDAMLDCGSSVCGGDQGNEPQRVVANDHRPHAGHGEQRPERTLGDLSGGCGEGGGTEGLAHTGSLGRRGRSDGDAGGLRGEIQTSGSCGGGAEAGLAHTHSCGGEEPEHQQANLPSEPSGGNAEAMGNALLAGSSPEWSSRGQQDGLGEPSAEAMGNASQRKDNGRESRDLGQAAREGRCGNDAADCTGEVLGNAESWWRGESGDEACKRQGHWPSRSGGSDDEQRKTEQSMGLHSNGTSDGLGHAELSGLCDSELAEIREWMVKCDNRTDELRLLGNGVVPATAERAFLTLLQELTK